MRRLLVLAAVLAVAGCTAQQGGGAAPTAAPSEPSAIWAGFVSCARAHGQPTMPDPVIAANGSATFPQAPNFNPKQAVEAVRADCGAILDGLPPQANPLAQRQVTAEYLDAQRRYAQCLREHGLPFWPDPDAEGHFTGGNFPPNWEHPDAQLQAQINRARDVCDPVRPIQDQ